VNTIINLWVNVWYYFTSFSGRILLHGIGCVQISIVRVLLSLLCLVIKFYFWKIERLKTMCIMGDYTVGEEEYEDLS
jgi:hypothetical protein